MFLAISKKINIKMRERKAIQNFGMEYSENAMEFLFKNILQIREKIAVEMIKQNFVIPLVINALII